MDEERFNRLKEGCLNEDGTLNTDMVIQNTINKAYEVFRKYAKFYHPRKESMECPLTKWQFQCSITGEK